MVRQDTAYFDIMPASILQDRLNTDAHELSGRLFDLPMRFLENILILAAGIYTTYSLQPKLAKLVMFPLPFLALMQYYMIKFMDKLGHRQVQ
jgi:ABC-type multidrug transport system fused ATPase/permease subunit